MNDAHILLVEDNPGDVHLIERAFEDRELPGELHAVEAGDEALDWLHQRGEFVGAPRPDVVLLDMNLPAIGGRAVFEEIKSDLELKRTPVITITGSRSETQLVELYDEGVNAYLIKPADPNEFADLIQQFAEFWADTVALPPVSDSSTGHTDV